MFNSVEASAADWEPCTRYNRHLFKCKARRCSFCSYCSRAFLKEGNKSRGSSLLLKAKYIKICERCFLCHSIVSCKYCNKCSQCCHKSACRGQTAKVLEKMARSGCRSEGCSNPERVLRPPLPDPAKLVKNPQSHKLLWQSSQKPQTVRGITSVYGQKCHRPGTQTDITRLFQPTISSPQTQQQMAANLRPEQSECFPQDRKIQDGDPGNYQNISSTGRVGNLHRLQGRLFPHSNTGTVQEILEISCPGPDLSIQSSTIWPVHSALGVHCHSKEVKLMAIQKGPPVPRRLVGESHIPPGMPPAYTGFSENVPGSWLDGEHRKVRTRPKTNLQLCLLPVRPPVRLGLSDSRPVAESTGKNTPYPLDLFGEGVHVPDRLVNSHRKTSSPRQVTHEAHSMAPQEQLADSRIPREKNPSAQIFTSPPTVVAEGKQCPHRTTITPNTACSASLYRHIKRRVGHSLKRVHCQRNLVSTRKQATHKLPRTQGSVSSLKRIPRSMHGQDGSGSIRQYHGSSLHQQRGRHEVWSTLCPTMENLGLVYKQAGHPEGTTHPRSPKCCGRQIVQTGTDHSNRMVPSSTGFSTDLQKVAPTSDRSLK